MKTNKKLQILSLVLAMVIALATFAPSRAMAKSSDPTIVDLAISVNQQTGEFSTLIAALQAADLVDTFDGKKVYTVFAPTDTAFSKLGLNASNIGSLPKAQLLDILKYHVTRGRRLSQSVEEASRMRMLNREFTHVTKFQQDVYVNDSKIVSANIKASNGVIHVIDAVLLPPSD